MTRRVLTSRKRCPDCGIYHVTRREERRIEALRIAQRRIEAEYRARQEGK